MTTTIHVLFLVPTQDGDTAVILATVYYKPVALQELVRAGADLNVQNNVRYLLYTAVICDGSQLSLLGGSNCSDDLREKLEWTWTHRHPADWREYWLGHSGECEEIIVSNED